MRELRGKAIVKVGYIPTDENTADIFTKVLDRQPFEKHRRTAMNLPRLLLLLRTVRVSGYSTLVPPLWSCEGSHAQGYTWGACWHALVPLSGASAHSNRP